MRYFKKKELIIIPLAITERAQNTSAIKTKYVAKYDHYHGQCE